MITFWFEGFRSVFKKETPGIPHFDELLCEYSNGTPDGLKIYVFLHVMDFKLAEIYKIFAESCHRTLRVYREKNDVCSQCRNAIRCDQLL